MSGLRPVHEVRHYEIEVEALTQLGSVSRSTWGIAEEDENRALALLASVRRSERTKLTIVEVPRPKDVAVRAGVWRTPLHRYYFESEDPLMHNVPEASGAYINRWIVNAESFDQAWDFIRRSREAAGPEYRRDHCHDLTDNPGWRPPGAASGETPPGQSLPPVGNNERAGIWWSTLQKNIVILFDGTSNEVKITKADASGTNVFRLFVALADRTVGQQIALYVPGVGTNPAVQETLTPTGWLADRLQTTADKATGKGVRAAVEAGYEFLMRNYREGDRVFLFGFSRGAHSAQSLASMLHHVGLIDPSNATLTAYASKYYWEGPMGGNYFTASSYRKAIDRHHRRAESFKAAFGRDVEVWFLGMWDAVASMQTLAPRYTPPRESAENIKSAFHAVAIDENRAVFPVDRLIDREPVQQVDRIKIDTITGAQLPPIEPSVRSSMGIAQDRSAGWVTCYFSGVHSDVGGTYENHGLADVSLAWMARWADRYGLAIDRSAIPSPTQSSLRNPKDEVEGSSDSYTGEVHRHSRLWIRFKDRSFNDTALIHDSVVVKLLVDSEYARRHGLRQDMLVDLIGSGTKAPEKRDLDFQPSSALGEWLQNQHRIAWDDRGSTGSLAKLWRNVESTPEWD